MSEHPLHRTGSTVRWRLARRGMRVDTARAARELGYRPGPIRDALADAVAWLARRDEVLRPLPETALALQDA